MEKRMILAIAMSLAVLLGYQYFTAAPPPPPGAASGKDNAASGTASAGKGGADPATGTSAGGLSPKTATSVRTIAVKTPLYTAILTTEGGSVSSFLLTEYKDAPGPGGKPLDIVGGKKASLLPLSLYLDEDRPLLPSPLVFASDAPAEIALKAGENRSVLLTWESTAGVRWTREYVFHGDKYDFEVRVQAANGSKEAVAVRPGLELAQVYEGELAGDSYSFAGVVVDPGKGSLK
ncbi:MAG TPA: membrane protein insertase YidC, partial [Candidatus Methylomirabilis sp.]|nr:membrane protein insertase YidC [Candidatus Methylomirabilis sp.]